MEIIISTIGLAFILLGGLISLMMKLGRLEGRLDTLEGKKHFERAEQEFALKLESMLRAAQERLTQVLNPQAIIHDIEVSRQQTIQQIEQQLDTVQLSDVNTLLQELTAVKQQVLATITQANSSATQLRELEEKVTQSLEAFNVKVIETINRADAHRLSLEQEFKQSLTTQLADFEKKRQIILTEISRVQEKALQELRQEITKLKQSTKQSSDPMTELANTLPEISFETAFIDSNKKIRRETRKARQLVENLGNNVTLEMIYIPGGNFMMGSNDSDEEKPIHSVTIKPFFAGKYPVTQAQWEVIMGDNPSNFKGVTRPVETVTWNDVMKFCANLSQMTGKSYRLLSEAQWEYACRAGTTTKYCFGDIITPDLANYDGSGIKQTTPVGKYPANAFGLYDMHGNVWEWCEDSWHENYVGAPTDGSARVSGSSGLRVLRGGSWFNPSGVRSAYRFRDFLYFRGNVGFRLIIPSP